MGHHVAIIDPFGVTDGVAGQKPKAVNWIDWSLKDGSTTGSPNAPSYGQELSEWTRGLIALRKRWTHFRRPDFLPPRKNILTPHLGTPREAPFGPPPGRSVLRSVVVLSFMLICNSYLFCVVS